MSKSKLVQAVIYARVSTHDQDCARQINDLTDWAKKCGYEIVDVLKEKESGAKTDRKQREKIMQLARHREITAVLVTELSRWGRSVPDLINTLEELNTYGVSLLTQNGFQFDLSTAQGKLMLSLIGGLAQFERDLLRERVKSGIALAKLRGKKIGRQPGQKIRPHPMTKQIISMVKAGVAYRTIAANLNLSKTTVQAVVNKNRDSLK